VWRLLGLQNLLLLKGRLNMVPFIYLFIYFLIAYILRRKWKRPWLNTNRLLKCRIIVYIVLGGGRLYEEDYSAWVYLLFEF